MITIEYLRSFKVGPYAIFDFVVSFIGMYYLAPVLSGLFRIFRLDIPQINWLYLILPLGIIFHLIFSQQTPLTKLFLDPTSYFFIKIFILGLLYLGLRGIKIIKP